MHHIKKEITPSHNYLNKSNPVPTTYVPSHPPLRCRVVPPDTKKKRKRKKEKTSREYQRQTSKLKPETKANIA